MNRKGSKYKKNEKKTKYFLTACEKWYACLHSHVSFLLNTRFKIKSRILPAFSFTILVRINRSGISRVPLDPPEHQVCSDFWSQSLCFFWKLLPGSDSPCSGCSFFQEFFPPASHLTGFFLSLFLGFSAISSKSFPGPQEAMEHLWNAWNALPTCVVGASLERPWHTLLGVPQRLAPQRHLSLRSLVMWSTLLQAMAQGPKPLHYCGLTVFNTLLPKLLCLSVSTR